MGHGGDGMGGLGGSSGGGGAAAGGIGGSGGNAGTSSGADAAGMGPNTGFGFGDNGVGADGSEEDDETTLSFSDAVNAVMGVMGVTGSPIAGAIAAGMIGLASLSGNTASPSDSSDASAGPDGNITNAGVQKTQNAAASKQQIPQSAVVTPQPEVDLSTAEAAANALEIKKADQRKSIDSLRSNQGIGFFAPANTYRPQLGI